MTYLATALLTTCALHAGTAGVPHPIQDPQDPLRRVDADLQVQINQAIDRGIAHLLSQQHRDGSWTGAAFGSYKTGPTAFASYALVEQGVNPQSDAIQAALDYLKRTPVTMVYSAGSILLLLAEIGGKEHLVLAQQCLDQLIAWESSSVRGTWSYPSGPVDLSNMQFVALGFWSADRLGLKVPDEVVKRLTEATVERFQEDPFPAPRKESTENAKTLKRERDIAGFHYFLERDSRPPSGSMTAAGLCIQRIGRELSGKKLGSRLLRTMDRSEQLGLGWLDAHWSTSSNYGHHEKGQLLYYLYALERLGAFYDTELIEGHPWYEPGARQILSIQKDDGAWGRLHETGYSLLFLSRASRISTTGEPRPPREDLWSLDTGSVRLRATGRMEIVAWISGIETETPIFVDKVDWFIDDEIVSTVDADETVAWQKERFPLRWLSDQVGERKLRARLSILEPDGQSHERLSDSLTIKCNWTAEEWIRQARQTLGKNLLQGQELEISANVAETPAMRAVDGYEGTAWVITNTPEVAPRIEIIIEKGVRANTVTLSQAASSVAALPNYQGVTRIRLTVNGTTTEHTLPSLSPGAILLPLEKRTKVRFIAVEILEPTAGRRGLAEIGLR